ncbi:MAG: tetratricopeptide repeat protein [Planctomycetes bacterium]|nr:tetratricopeptide repeat protein [Planctomycetota bacterium]
MNEPKSEKSKEGKFSTRALWIFLLLGLLIRIGHGVAAWHDNPLATHLIADALYYENWSEAIVQGNTSGESPFYLPPLYPYLLALVRTLFGSTLPAMLFIQGILGLLSLWLIHLLTMHFFGKAAAFCALFLALFYAPLLFFETKLLATSLSIFLGLLSVFLLLIGAVNKKPRAFALAGFSIGLLCLARPNFLIFAALTSGFLLLEAIRSHEGNWKRPAIFGLGLVIPLALSLAHNLASSGEMILITGNGGINFYFGNHAAASGVNDAPTRDFSSIFDQRAAAKRMAERAEGATLSQGDVSAYWMRKGLSEIKEDPTSWFGLLLKKAKLYFSSFGYGVIYIPEVEAHLSRVHRLLIIPTGLIIALGAGGIWIALRRRIRGLCVLLLFLFSNVATVLLFFMAERFRVPFMAGLLPFAGLCLAQGIQALRSGARLRPVIGFTAIAGFTLLSCYLVDDTIRQNQYARARISLGKAFMEAGKYSEAREEIAAAIALIPSAAGVFHLGLISEAQGRIDEAEAHFEEALFMDPCYLEPLERLAALYEKAKDWDQAIATRMQIVEIAPDRFEAYYNLGLTCIDANRIDQGLKHLEKAAELDRMQALVWETLGQVYRRKKTPDKALMAFKTAIDLNPVLEKKWADEIRSLEAELDHQQNH